MLLLPPRFTRTYTLFPYTALFLAELHRRARDLVAGDLLRPRLQRRRRIGNDLHGNRTRRGIGHGGRLRRLGWKKRRSEEHTSELQSLMRISYAVFCLKNKQHYKSKINTENREHKDEQYTQV